MSHVRKANIASLARALPTWKDFDYVYKRIRDFLRYSRFTVKQVYCRISLWLIEHLAHEHDQYYIPILIDWTDYGIFKALHLAMAFKKRALPLFATIVKKNLLEGSMTLIEVEILEAFFKSIPKDLWRRILIIADRGFCKVELFEKIREFGAHWAIRSPRNKWIQIEGCWRPLSSVDVLPGEQKNFLHVPFTKEHQQDSKNFIVNIAIRRAMKNSANNLDDDIWYITTDLEPAKMSLWFYEKRMWIDEMFRDFKNSRNGFALKQHCIKSEEVMEKLVLVISLSYIVLIYEGLNQFGKIPLRVVSRKKRYKQYLSILQIAIVVLEKILQDPPNNVYQGILSIWCLI
jgi:hypothetical protein